MVPNKIDPDKRPHLWKCPYCSHPFYEKKDAKDHIKLKHAKQVDSGHNCNTETAQVEKERDQEPGTIFERV
jgi:uncharacterized C2H2 Zn-finger protein